MGTFTIKTTKKSANDHTDLSIQREQIIQLYNAIPASAVATLANVVMLAVIQWNYIDQRIIITWFILITLITGIRWLTSVAYKRSSQEIDDTLIWKRRFNIGTLSAAIMWGLGMIFLFPEKSLIHQAFLAFIMAGMCAGAVTSLSFMLFPVRAFLLLSLVPLITQLLLGEWSIMIAMGVMILIFLIIIWTSSTRIYLSTLQNIRLRFESAKQEQALEESEAKYRLIFDSAPLGIIQYDIRGRINSINPAFEEILGQSKRELIGKSLLYDVHDDDIINAVTQSLKGETGHIKTSAKRLGGSSDTPIRAYFRGLTSKISKLSGGVGIIEDISEDQRVQKMKDEFISTISHELRTPLTAIRGSLGLMNAADKIDEKQLEHLVKIANRNSDRLLYLINDILDISKLESGQIDINLEIVDANEFLHRIIEINAPYGKEYHVNFVIKPCHEKLMLRIDTHRMMQVFSNLLSNAAKFSSAGSTVEVSAYRKDQRIIFAVKDQGCGIPESFYPYIFEKFMQVDSSDSRNSSGTGLGLSISKAIVEKHQGKISFESRQDEGTTFYVDLPASPTE